MTARWLLLIASLGIASYARADFVLADESVLIDSNLAIRFTQKQIDHTSVEVRNGFLRWAATRSGRRLLRHFTAHEYRIVVREDAEEPAIGRAPEPTMIMFLTASDHTKVKSYDLILNPMPWKPPPGTLLMPNEPSSTTDLIAAAWAAEMLHIELYARGIRLPHHHRDDFQEAWMIIAAELGFPAMTHGDEEPARSHDWRRAARQRR